MSGQALDVEWLSRAAGMARAHLLSRRNDRGHWEGRLSSSALSTATAVGALAFVAQQSSEPHPLTNELVASGLAWLAGHANEDGSWGDTTLSLGNISTTTLAWAAFGMAGADHTWHDAVHGAQAWIAERAGSVSPGQLAAAITRRYGKDKTFSVPILTMCAISGRLGPERTAWRLIRQLPFELAAFPQDWFAALRLPVVSYALPALIAMGLARHRRLPSANPLSRSFRDRVTPITLEVLKRIQPTSGGFLEATPLTSFVAMSLAAAGYAAHPVTQSCIRFIVDSVREDGSWPIDTNLATWATTLSLNALMGEGGSRLNAADCAAAPSEYGVPASAGGNARTEAAATVQPQPSAPNPSQAGDEGFLDSDACGGTESGAPDFDRALDWLLSQQYREVHPYTNAAPGGWAWTDLTGGVPDADDTSGAIVSLAHCYRDADAGHQEQIADAACDGLRWLFSIQNGDGGIPTFCQGWTRLPFDQSSADITAHALRAWAAWTEIEPALASGWKLSARRALRYLMHQQRVGGYWLPLWFGNQHEPHEANPLYGTAKVLIALAQPAVSRIFDPAVMMGAGLDWMLKAQLSDGAWSGFPGGPASVEETALGVEALAACLRHRKTLPASLPWAGIQSSLERGAAWLAAKVESGTWTQPSPIGFYFAKLWYYEDLYPVIFANGALASAVAALKGT